MDLSICQTARVFHVGDVIRKLRKDRGWTLADLVEKSGVSKMTISTLERNQGNYKRETLESLAAALGKTTAELHAMVRGLQAAEPETVNTLQAENDDFERRIQIAHETFEADKAHLDHRAKDARLGQILDLYTQSLESREALRSLQDRREALELLEPLDQDLLVGAVVGPLPLLRAVLRRIEYDAPQRVTARIHDAIRELSGEAADLTRPGAMEESALPTGGADDPASAREENERLRSQLRQVQDVARRLLTIVALDDTIPGESRDAAEPSAEGGEGNRAAG
jgi:transcriptional regulator with XRE-family HTH domain